MQAKAGHFYAVGHQRLGQHIVAIDHRLLATPKNAVLRLMVGHQRAVVIQMILTDIEHGRDFCAKVRAALELETR